MCRRCGDRGCSAALACLLAGLALAFPAAALLVAQASALGLVLAVLAVFIARLVARPCAVGRGYSGEWNSS